MEYKRNVLWTTTKLKDKEIRISCLKNFKISLQISNFRRILAQAEFQYVLTYVGENKLVLAYTNRIYVYKMKL